MKKIITILSLVAISIIFIVGCSSSKNSDKLYIGNCPDAMFGMGKRYYINNLEDGEYEIEFITKEYEQGILKEERILHKSVVEHNGDNNTLKVGIVNKDEEEYNLKAIVNDGEYDGYALGYLKDDYNKGVAMSILNQDKYFKLDNEVAIAVYGIEGENGITEGINIDEEFDIGNNNLKDLVVYIKLHKIN